jgi:sortase A
VPPDVTVLPAGPPETLPDFTIIESPTAPGGSTSLAAPTPTPRPRPSPTGEALEATGEAAPANGHKPAQSPPTRIVAASIGLDSPIVPAGWRVEGNGEGPQAVWEVPSNAVGWHVNSQYPGNGGNVVLSGHNNVAGEVFRDLIDLEVGDIVQLYVNHLVYPYAVVGKVLLEEKGMPIEVRRQNAEWIAPTDYERLTLVSCWPYSTYTHRLIVIARPAA